MQNIVICYFTYRMLFSCGILLKILCTDFSEVPDWLSQLSVQLLISAQVMTSGSSD